MYIVRQTQEARTIVRPAGDPVQELRMSNVMPTRMMGRDGPRVSMIGLGCMAMSGVYADHDEHAGIRTIHAGMERGITMLNTGDFYGSGRNEMMIARALEGKRERAFISVKTGALRSPTGDYIGFDMRPQSIRNFIAYSLNRLQTEYIDLYQPSRVDPAVPIEDTIGAIADLVRQGYVRHVGLSEAGPETIRRAHAVHPITAHEVEYSLLGRGIEDAVLPTCRELGIATVAYSVLAGGLLGGNYRPGVSRSHSPRFQPEHLPRNLALVEALRTVATSRGIEVADLAMAWVLSRGEDILPLIGARRPEALDSAFTAAALALSADDLAAIERAIPRDAGAGSQYDGFVHDMIERERAQR